MRENYFAIADRDSILDLATYLQIMDASGLTYDHVDRDAVGLASVSGVIRCEERLINTDATREHFRSALGTRVRLGHRVTDLRTISAAPEVDGERFAAVVVCTDGTFARPAEWDVFYEPCVTLLYRGSAEQAAYTIMDGPFHSLFPFGGGLFTLTSVRHTPLARTETVDEAQSILAKTSKSRLARVRATMESEFARFYPAFHERLDFVGFDFAIKTKLRDASDARPAIVSGDGRVVQVLAGKIDAVFEAADEVCQMLGAVRLRPPRRLGHGGPLPSGSGEPPDPRQ